MGLYATPAQVLAEIGGLEGLTLPSGEQLVRLVAAAERAVDQRLGPLEADPATGLKLTPALLTEAQKAALVRAVAVAAAHLAELDLEAQLGLDDFAPAVLRPLRGRGLPALIDAELAGLGLLGRSGTALPDPEPVPDDLLA